MHRRSRTDRPLRLTRRRALQAGAAAFTAAAAGCGDYLGADLDLDVDHLELVAEPSAGAAPSLDVPVTSMFPLSVASGITLAGGNLVWARYRGQRPVWLSVWREDDGEEVASRVLDPTAHAHGAFLKLFLPALQAGAQHAFAFFELDDEGRAVARSPVGRFRAPAAAGAREEVTLGATGCTELGVGFEVVEAAAREPTDAFILLGDTVYADDSVGLSGLRGLWHETFRTPAYRALREGRPVMAIWDDHEVGNNWDPEDVEPGRVDDAKLAFFEHLPLERIAEDPGRIWRTHRFGDTVEVFLLDGRGERRPSTRGHTDELLSDAQLRWLKDGLAASTAVFKLVVTGIPVGDVPLPNAEDRWPGYRAQREELLRFIDDGPIRGVLFLAGDVHMAWIGAVSASGAGRDVLEVGAGCGAKALTNPLASLFTGPQYTFAASVNNYATLRFLPDSGEVEVVHKTATDVLHRAVLKPR